MSYVQLAHFWSIGLPKRFNAHPKLLCVLGLGSPSLSTKHLVRSGLEDGVFGPVNVHFLKIVLGPPACMFWVVILLETMVSRAMLFYKW